MNVFLSDLRQLCSAQVKNQPLSLPKLMYQYADCSHWMKQYLERTNFAADIAYWKGYLAGDLPLLQLPTDFPRPALLRYAGGMVKFSFSHGPL